MFRFRKPQFDLFRQAWFVTDQQGSEFEITPIGPRTICANCQNWHNEGLQPQLEDDTTVQPFAGHNSTDDAIIDPYGGSIDQTTTGGTSQAVVLYKRFLAVADAVIEDEERTPSATLKQLIQRHLENMPSQDVLRLIPPSLVTNVITEALGASRQRAASSGSAAAEPRLVINFGGTIPPPPKRALPLHPRALALNTFVPKKQGVDSHSSSESEVKAHDSGASRRPPGMPPMIPSWYRDPAHNRMNPSTLTLKDSQGQIAWTRRTRDTSTSNPKSVFVPKNQQSSQTFTPKSGPKSACSFPPKRLYGMDRLFPPPPKGMYAPPPKGTFPSPKGTFPPKGILSYHGRIRFGYGSLGPPDQHNPNEDPECDPQARGSTDPAPPEVNPTSPTDTTITDATSSAKATAVLFPSDPKATHNCVGPLCAHRSHRTYFRFGENQGLPHGTNTTDPIHHQTFWLTSLWGANIIQFVIHHQLDEDEVQFFGPDFGWTPHQHWLDRNGESRGCGQGCGCCRSHNPEDGPNCDSCYDKQMFLYTCKAAAKAITKCMYPSGIPFRTAISQFRLRYFPCGLRDQNESRNPIYSSPASTVIEGPIELVQDDSTPPFLTEEEERDVDLMAELWSPVPSVHTEIDEDDEDDVTDPSAPPSPRPLVCQGRRPHPQGSGPNVACGRLADNGLGEYAAKCCECGRGLCRKCCRLCQMTNKCKRTFCIYHCGAQVTIGGQSVTQYLARRQNTGRFCQNFGLFYNTRYPGSTVPDRLNFFHECKKYEIKDRRIGEVRQLKYPQLGGQLSRIDHEMDDVCGVRQPTVQDIFENRKRLFRGTNFNPWQPGSNETNPMNGRPYFMNDPTSAWLDHDGWLREDAAPFLNELGGRGPHSALPAEEPQQPMSLAAIARIQNPELQGRVRDPESALPRNWIPLRPEPLGDLLDHSSLQDPLGEATDNELIQLWRPDVWPPIELAADAAASARDVSSRVVWPPVPQTNPSSEVGDPEEEWPRQVNFPSWATPPVEEWLERQQAYLHTSDPYGDWEIEPSSGPVPPVPPPTITRPPVSAPVTTTTPADTDTEKPFASLPENHERVQRAYRDAEANRRTNPRPPLNPPSSLVGSDAFWNDFLRDEKARLRALDISATRPIRSDYDYAYEATMQADAARRGRTRVYPRPDDPTDPDYTSGSDESEEEKARPRWDRNNPNRRVAPPWERSDLTWRGRPRRFAVVPTSSGSDYSDDPDSVHSAPATIGHTIPQPPPPTHSPPLPPPPPLSDETDGWWGSQASTNEADEWWEPPAWSNDYDDWWGHQSWSSWWGSHTWSDSNWWDDQSALWVTEPQWGYAILSAGGDDPNTEHPATNETNDRSNGLDGQMPGYDWPGWPYPPERDGDGPDEGPPSFQ